MFLPGILPATFPWATCHSRSCPTRRWSRPASTRGQRRRWRWRGRRQIREFLKMQGSLLTVCPKMMLRVFCKCWCLHPILLKACRLLCTAYLVPQLDKVRLDFSATCCCRWCRWCRCWCRSSSCSFRSCCWSPGCCCCLRRTCFFSVFAVSFSSGRPPPRTRRHRGRQRHPDHPKLMNFGHYNLFPEHNSTLSSFFSWNVRVFS